LKIKGNHLSPNDLLKSNISISLSSIETNLVLTSKSTIVIVFRSILTHKIDSLQKIIQAKDDPSAKYHIRGRNIEGGKSLLHAVPSIPEDNQLYNNFHHTTKDSKGENKLHF